MKKVISIFLVLVFALAVLVGCGGNALEAELQEFVDMRNEDFELRNTETLHTTAEVRNGVSIAYRFFIGEVEDVDAVLEEGIAAGWNTLLDTARLAVADVQSVIIEIVDESGEVLGYRELR